MNTPQIFNNADYYSLVKYNDIKNKGAIIYYINNNL